MANTTTQLDCAEWVRQSWLPERLGQPFRKDRIELDTGGVESFDAVSEDGRIAVEVSTSSLRTASGGMGAGKLNRIWKSILFLSMARASRRILVLTQPDMYERWLSEKQAGRVPSSVEFMHAPLPAELCGRLAEAKDEASAEVMPAAGPMPVDDADLARQVVEATPSVERLARLAGANLPPASWWDDSTDPFEPATKG